MTDLRHERSLLDKTWNDAIEAAATDCEGEALALRSMNGESESWVWDAANRFHIQAARIRRLKR